MRKGQPVERIWVLLIKPERELGQTLEQGPLPERVMALAGMKFLRLVQEQDIMEEELVVLELVMALELRPLEQPLLQPVQWHGLIVRSENYKMGRNGPQVLILLQGKNVPPH